MDCTELILHWVIRTANIAAMCMDVVVNSITFVNCDICTLWSVFLLYQVLVNQFFFLIVWNFLFISERTVNETAVLLDFVKILNLSPALTFVLKQFQFVIKHWELLESKHILWTVRDLFSIGVRNNSLFQITGRKILQHCYKADYQPFQWIDIVTVVYWMF